MTAVLTKESEAAISSVALQPANAFTVDVEDYFQVQAFAGVVPRRQWETFPCRVVENTRRTLRLLDDYGVRGTFFILGWVADRFPQLVREIQQDGHEIGCHSYWHRLIYQMTPEEFAADLAQASEAIGSITGDPVTAFRAPSFSITEESLWALDVLGDQGYVLDSSIFPIRHDNYGIPTADRDPHLVHLESGGSIREFPMTVANWNGFPVPAAGGGYFRLVPARMFAWLLRRTNLQEGRHGVFYIHPWELDPEQPRIKASWKSRFRHYQNLDGTERKLRYLLQNFNWSTLTETWWAATRSDNVPSIFPQPVDWFGERLQETAATDGNISPRYV